LLSNIRQFAGIADRSPVIPFCSTPITVFFQAFELGLPPVRAPIFAIMQESIWGFGKRDWHKPLLVADSLEDFLQDGLARAKAELAAIK
jgi:hypothetical protein